ncbi:hypothetical protein PsYK624_157640 [Phanerochaete sordida]|uniref:Uncharacterized protein n=1 Tax=Phanerochaete sordida TaxID=48140 RepID=A0A9P3GPU3_9APHY|nr:hypothetical protein PsYK624_157640 [Phanerochaete sordida]
MATHIPTPLELLAPATLTHTPGPLNSPTLAYTPGQPLKIGPATEWFKEHVRKLPEDSGYLLITETYKDYGVRDVIWSFWPFKVTIHVVGTGFKSQIVLALSIDIPFVGSVELGSIAGSLEEGVELKVNVAFAQGLVRVYLKGLEVRLYAQLASPFGDVDTDVELFEI